VDSVTKITLLFAVWDQKKRGLNSKPCCCIEWSYYQIFTLLYKKYINKTGQL